jgi:putative flippase GtrA
MTLRSTFDANVHRIELVVRYYGVGALNTGFGYSLFALLVFVGLNLYVAQILAHFTGVAFNYFTYSRHVFHESSQRRPRAFVASYVFNYFIGLALLASAHHFVRSPYIAGFIAMLIGTAINFFILRRFVFPPLQKAPQS